MKRIEYVILAAGLLCWNAFAAQDSTLSQREVRDPRQLETILEANASDAQTRLTALEAGTLSSGATVTGTLTVISTNAATTNVLVTVDALLDGEHVVADSIDDDSIDLSTGTGLSGADMPDEDLGDVSVLTGSWTLDADTVDSANYVDASIDAEHISIPNMSGAAALVATAGVATDANYIGAVHYDVITFTNVLETFTNGSDEGESQVICAFPEGRIYILSAAINATVTNSNPGFEANANDIYYVGVGSVVAADDATLSSTEQDIIAVQTLDTVSDSVTSFEVEEDMTAGGDSVYDGTAGAQSLYLNLCVADSSISNNVTVGVSGTLSVAWAFLGDD